MVKILKRKKKGVVSMEWVILSPFMLFIFFTCVMMLIFVMNKITYSNTCSDLAQEMNLGDTGYKTYSAGTIGMTSKDYENKLLESFGVSHYVGDKNVEITTTKTAEGSFESTFYYFLGNYINNGRFNCPYSTLEKIECRVYNGNSEVTNFSTDPLKTESGDMVEVSATYKFFIFNIKAYGYSFII